jgi:hypothetical protein
MAGPDDIAPCQIICNIVIAGGCGVRGISFCWRLLLPMRANIAGCPRGPFRVITEWINFGDGMRRYQMARSITRKACVTKTTRQTRVFLG